ncbi:POT family-domain-containing protein [Bisporella sp. PMI_857]|nr:POT family-domain-containing protein [Bisporella sp. PMI_857]
MLRRILTKQNRHALPGALGLGQSTATNIYNAFSFFSFLAPMGFALISDIWLGRHKTLLLSLMLYLCGCLVMFTTSLPTALDNGAGVPGLAVSMVLIGLGVGGVKATFSPFLGDQYVQNIPQLTRRKNGEMAIVDRTLTLQLIYNIFYWFTNVAAMSTVATTFLEKEFDFWLSYLMGTISLCITLAIFAFTSSKLVRIPPQGNVLPKATKVLVRSCKSGFKLSNAKPEYQAMHYGQAVPWTDQFVDELKRGLIACRVIFSFVVFYLAIGQLMNNLVSQAGQMKLYGIPNDMINSMAGVGCIVLGPVFQALYSFLGRRKIKFGPIARITVAFLVCGGAMAYAAGIQKLIYSAGPCYDRPLACALSQGGRVPNDVNVWLQLPMYFIIAVAEILGFVTVSEYSYSKAPPGMRTIVQALTQLTAAVGSAFGMAITPLAKDPTLIIMYSCLTGAIALSAGLFWWRFRKYDKMDAELNRLNE